MQHDLIEKLRTIKDPRRGEGRRHDLVFVLIIVIMATMSGYFGYRGIGDFIARNRKSLLNTFKPKKGRLPTFATIRRIMLALDFEELTKVFHEWSQGYVSIETSDWLAIDGKAICGTLSNKNTSMQSFVSLVSVYSTRTRSVIAASKIPSSKVSEIPTVRELIKQLDIEGAVFTIDALHCQKKL